MKRKHIILLLWGLWICSLAVAVVCINNHINNKRSNLRVELWDNIDNLFKGQSNGDFILDGNDGLFFEDYSNKPVRNYEEDKFKLEFEQSYRPSESLAELGIEPYRSAKDMDDEQERTYGDLAALYVLNWGDDYPNYEDEGWNIVRVCHYNEPNCIIRTNVIFPYKVGLKKTKWGNPYTVEQAVNKAYEFYTTNSKSWFSDRFQRGSCNSFWSKIYDCCNDYYTIVENKNHNEFSMGINVSDYPFSRANHYFQIKNKPFEYGWMQDGFCRVFIATTQENYYMVKENEWVVNGERNKLYIWWCVGLTLFFLSIIIPLSVIEKKSKNRKSETLYKRLSRLCNPKEFMKNYDKERVDKANCIYQRLMSTRPNDQETLMELQELAVSELGITLIDTEEVEELKERVNPKRFLNPYNAEKVALANELFAILSKDGLTYKEFCEVEERAKSL